MEFNSWCLQVLHEFNPFAFARSLTSAFDVTVIGKGGEEIPVGHADVHGFMYRNIMQNGCVDDVVLRLRKGARVPRLARMVKGADDLRIWREAQRLRRELREERDRRYFGLGKWMSARAPANGDARQTDHTASPFENAGPAHRPAIVVQQRRPAAETAEPGKNMHLQLLRALAICFVLGAHLSITSSLLMHLPFAASNPGWIGVELFFVVSGYVVTLSMASARFSVASFVIRRVFRLYPLLLLFLLVLLAAKLATDALAPGAPPLFSPSLEAMYHQALAMLLAYHPSSEWGLSVSNMAVWSLSVELRFYASLAIFVGLLNLLSEDRGAHRRNILSAAAIVYLTGAGARILTCFGITFELGELLIGKMYDFIALGTVAALLPSSWTERIARHTRAAIWLLVFAPLMLVMVVGSPGSPGSHPVFFNLAMLAVGLMFAMVVVICTSQQSAPHLSRRVRTLGNFLGDRSYAIFLLHLPVLNVAWALGQRFGQDGGYWQWPLFQLAIALVLLPPLVELAHRYIELPMIDAGRSLARRLRGLQGQVADPIWARPARRQPDLPWERAA
jgi:peptidoglycan/LPS O-acetylase OafA/YrhL